MIKRGNCQSFHRANQGLLGGLEGITSLIIDHAPRIGPSQATFNHSLRWVRSPPTPRGEGVGFGRGGSNTWASPIFNTFRQHLLVIAFLTNYRVSTRQYFIMDSWTSSIKARIRGDRRSRSSFNSATSSNGTLIPAGPPTTGSTGNGSSSTSLSLPNNFNPLQSTLRPVHLDLGNTPERIFIQKVIKVIDALYPQTYTSEGEAGRMSSLPSFRIYY